jgi:hypothetical protein
MRAFDGLGYPIADPPPPRGPLPGMRLTRRDEMTTNGTKKINESVRLKKKFAEITKMKVKMEVLRGALRDEVSELEDLLDSLNTGIEYFDDGLRYLDDGIIEFSKFL